VTIGTTDRATGWPIGYGLEFIQDGLAEAESGLLLGGHRRINTAATLLFPRISVPLRNSAPIQSVVFPMLTGFRCFMDGPTRSRAPCAMKVGVGAKGYQILVVGCDACGHCGHVDPKRATPRKRFRCRTCGGRRCHVRRSWHEGVPPDNVIPLTRGRSH
jgi:hypothetical protein